MILLTKRRKQLFISLSLLILLLDLTFVAINYQSSSKVLQQTLQDEAETAGKIYSLHIENVFTNMMQLATYIGNSKELNELFLQGKLAVTEEGGGAGAEQAARARQMLLDKIKPSWDVMTKKFNVRQLHYHLGPGSISFLRVHKPTKYGDEMHDIRHIIVDTNAQRTARQGFETGRIYSGLRAVVPIFADNEDYVGALEVGTSFDGPLSLIKQTQGFDLLVLLKKDHVNRVMWQDYLEERFADGPTLCNSVVESSTLEPGSLPLIFQGIQQITEENGCAMQQVGVIDSDTRSLLTYALPLYDYQTLATDGPEPVGSVVILKDVSHEIENFNQSLYKNIVYSVLAFLLIELVFLYSLRLESKMASLHHESRHDELTLLPNRRDYQDTLNREINRHKRGKLPLGLVLLDVDKFKNYNDAYGHSQGDDCLHRVASCLQQSLSRAGDYVARIGGEEFAVILPNTALEQAEKAAEKIRAEVERLGLPHQENSGGVVTVSLGLAVNEQANISPQALFNAADACLYTAKKEGRNRIVSTLVHNEANGHSGEVSGGINRS